MRETPEELNELQALLDASLSRSTAHLRSIITERTLTAEQLTRILTGMCTLALSTVTVKGEPRISGVDGHLLHGKWYFGTARTAAKARHLAARPAASDSRCLTRLWVPRWSRGGPDDLACGDHYLY